MTIHYNDPKPQDAQAILDYLNQAGIESDNLSFGEEGIGISLEDETAYLEKIQNDPNEFMILAKENLTIVGIANLTRGKRPRTQHVATLGISLLKSHWHQGLGTELMKQIMDRAKKSNLEVIRLDVRSDNLIAIKLYTRFGFEKIGCFEEEMKIDGHYISIDQMRVRLK